VTPKQQAALDAIVKYGSQVKAAKALGISRSALRHRINSAKAYQESDDGIKYAMNETGMVNINSVHSGWIKTDDVSLYFRNEIDKIDTSDIAESIRDVINGIVLCEIVKPPEVVEDNLLTLYPIADAHIGMRADANETGEDYNSDIAVDRIKTGMAKCVASSPQSKVALVLDVGDLTHADDNNAQTPRSKHPLDVSERFFYSLRCAIIALASAIDCALQKHEQVICRVLRGNHNETSYLAVMFAIAERYKNNTRVTVEQTSADFFVHEFGSVMIAAHHGDKAKADRLVLHMADAWPEIWGRTKHRFYFTGHLHHTMMREIGGVLVEQLRAVTGKDSYASSHAYSSRSQMQGITYHKEEGEVSRVKVCL
jgi:hypothetical protein